MPLRLLSRLRSLWRNLTRKDAVERELAEEVRSYVELLTERKIEEGYRPEEARRAALLELGGVEQVKENIREVKMGHHLETIWQDLRYGARMLLKQKGFTAVAALSLALGIGANTAIFSLLDVVLLKSLPVHEPERLVLFGRGQDVGMTNSFPNRSWDLFSYPFYREVRRRGEVFTDVAAIQSMPSAVHGTVRTNEASGEDEQIAAQLVSGTYFTVLGVTPTLGRAFTAADDENPGGHPVTVISHAWWTRRFGSDPAVVGKSVTIDRVDYTIIGVAPRDFFGTTVGQSPDIWVPLAMEAQMPPTHWEGRNEPLFQSLYLLARLKEGVSAEQAKGAVSLYFNQFLREQAGAEPAPARLQDLQRAAIELTPAGRGLSDLRRQFSVSLQILMAVVAVVLLIACANVANLLLSRAAARQKEFAMRLALGAGRRRLIRQLLTESLLLALLGGTAGILLAWWGGQMLVQMVSGGSETLPLDITPNARVLGFTLLVSLLSAVIFGTVPALRAIGVEPNSSLNGGRGSVRAASQSPLGKVLVTAQVALSLLLLVGAGLFVRTLINLQNVPTGFNEAGVLQFQLDTATTGYKDAQLANLLREVEERVKGAPGVQSASFSFFTFNQGGWSGPAFTRAQAPPEGVNNFVMQNIVGPDYFTTMGIPLLLGRSFGAQDTETSSKVAVVSETMARRFFPEGSPLGRRFGTHGPESSEEVEIIGVVKDVKFLSLTEQPRPLVYYPHAQGSGFLNNFVVRFSGAPEAVIREVRRVVREVNPHLPVDEVVPLAEHVGRSLVQQKLVARLATFFGLLALLLAAVGLYGVLSYAVARRTNEIGIRMALGAQTGRVLWLVLREALTLVLVGVIVGLAAALWATRLATTLLFGLEPTDPLTMASATLVLIVIATLASYLPARRAARIDPMVALRDE